MHHCTKDSTGNGGILVIIEKYQINWCDIQMSQIHIIKFKRLTNITMICIEKINYSTNMYISLKSLDNIHAWLAYIYSNSGMSLREVIVIVVMVNEKTNGDDGWRGAVNYRQNSLHISKMYVVIQ